MTRDVPITAWVTVSSDGTSAAWERPLNSPVGHEVNHPADPVDEAKVLLRENDAESLLDQRAAGLAELMDEQRGQAQARSSRSKEPRSHDETPDNTEHTLLAAAQRAGQLALLGASTGNSR